MDFLPFDSSLYSSKADQNDPRLGDLIVKLANSSEAKPNQLVVLGYPDDEGIQINGGRLGASQGPDAIRSQFYRMTPSLVSGERWDLADLGNLQLQPPLATRHEKAAHAVELLLRRSASVLSLGGSHDYAYADGKGFLNYYQKNFPKSKPLIMNFDAHFDVRPTMNGLSSGTPFYRLLNEFKNFNFLSIGMQNQCNSRNHQQWILDRGGKILLWDEIENSSDDSVDTILKFIRPHLTNQTPVYLSVDIDGFSSAFAPGCSQSFATGFTPEPFLIALQKIMNLSNVRIMGIYEVSPPLDFGVVTSRLAALIAHRFYSSLKAQETSL